MATFASRILGLVTLASLASSAVLPGALEPINDISHLANFSAIPLSLSSWSSEHTTPNISYSELGHILGQVGTPPYKCDPKAYGRDLHVRSCRDALLAIPADTRKLKLGSRGPGDRRNDVNLPYRFSSDDAVCVIEISPPVGGSYDVVTSLELARAAFSIVEGCVSNAELGRVGGEVLGLGQYKRLSISVSAYAPEVQCAPPGAPVAPPTAACDSVLSVMSASRNEKTFGPWRSSSDVDLPASIKDPTNGCMLVVRADVYTPRPDKATWYDIWAAAVAVRQMCVLKGRAGQSVRMGYRGALIVQLLSGRYPAGLTLTN
ncbi:MAG: hypothetical protein Q9212_001469 [Teloschistes hypoglaucus]